ncbi:MAG TPA: hypothetical protein PLD62_07915 [Candidatus Cloacimonadota bacterium]|nr:hypothetical protein [Candidatus Cloacimonadota bacterium]
MGTQQLLLIVLAVVIVAAAISAGIVMFDSRAKEANRRAVVQDMHNIAVLAISYYKIPASQGGGGGDGFFLMNRTKFYKFTGYQFDNTYIYTNNGRIFITKIGNEYFVIGYGNDLGFDEKHAISGLLRISGAAGEPILTFMN